MTRIVGSSQTDRLPFALSPESFTFDDCLLYSSTFGIQKISSLKNRKTKKKTNRDHILTWWPTDKSRPTIEVYDGDDRNDRILFRHVWVLAGLGRNRKESRRGKNLCLIHDWSLVSRGFLPQNKIKSKKLFTKFKIEKRRRIVFKRLFLFI